LARPHTDIAIATLAEVCGNRDATPAARVAAATALFDRAWGKPRMPIEHSGETVNKYVVCAPPEPPTAEEWLQTYAPKTSEPA
jgi:hypothetical protein